MKKLFAVILLAVIGAIGYAAHEPSTKIKQESADTKQRVLVATGGTDYEKAVTKILLEKLKQKRIEVKVIDVAAIAQEDANTYNAILLMHAVQEDTLKSAVREFLKRTPESESGPWPYVIVSTVTGRNWLSKDANVDAITSPTKVSQARNVANLLYGRIQAILDGKFK